MAAIETDFSERSCSAFVNDASPHHASIPSKKLVFSWFRVIDIGTAPSCYVSSDHPKQSLAGKFQSGVRLKELLHDATLRSRVHDMIPEIGANGARTGHASIEQAMSLSGSMLQNKALLATLRGDHQRRGTILSWRYFHAQFTLAPEIGH